ncbi:MAG: MGMT family protein [Pararobbsia sp.]
MLDVDQDDAAVRGHTGCNTMPAHAAQRRYDVGQEEAADTDHGGARGRDAGALTGYAGGLDRKARLLALERGGLVEDRPAFELVGTVTA